MPDNENIAANPGWHAPVDHFTAIDLTRPVENHFHGTTFSGVADHNPSKKLLDLLQDAYDAGADPDLDFNDYLHHAITGGRLHLEIN